MPSQLSVQHDTHHTRQKSQMSVVALQCVRVKRHGKVGTQRRDVQIAVWYSCMWYLRIMFCRCRQRNMNAKSRQRKKKKATSMCTIRRCTLHTDTGSPPCKQTRRYCARGWKRRGRATTARSSARESTSSAAPLLRVQPRKKRIILRN